MSNLTPSDDNHPLPMDWGIWFQKLPASLVPSTVKAFDRLVGATMDIPIAYLEQFKKRIEARTDAFGKIDMAVADSATKLVTSDPDIAQRAMDSLLRKEYRKQTNKEAVVGAAFDKIVEDETKDQNGQTTIKEEIEDDWLNVFEKYAEGASSERLRDLWSRVLAGEIRKPGAFSPKTMRYLSEVTKKEAEIFTSVAAYAIGDLIPQPPFDLTSKNQNIEPMLILEAAGLINSGASLGLSRTYTFPQHKTLLFEVNGYGLMLFGKPDDKAEIGCLLLTPIGQEVLSLVDRGSPIDIIRGASKYYKVNGVDAAAIVKITKRYEGGRVDLQKVELLWTNNPEFSF